MNHRDGPYSATHVSDTAMPDEVGEDAFVYHGSQSESVDDGEYRYGRFMQRHGRYLTRQKNNRHQARKMDDLFNWFVDMKWRWTLLSFALFYVSNWSFFALLYYGIEAARYAARKSDYDTELSATNTTSFPEPDYGYCIGSITKQHAFSGMFLYSLETQTTIGYGYRAITPNCPEAIIVQIVQIMSGALIDAFTVGYIIAKFSRPKKRAAKIMFSDFAVIGKRDGKHCLSFRVGNTVKDLFVEITVRALCIFEKPEDSKVEAQGKRYLAFRQTPMTLDIGGDTEKIMMVTPQLIHHIIDEDSPFYDLSENDLKALCSGTKLNRFARFEIMVILEGQIEATGMTMQARHSYACRNLISHGVNKGPEIRWGERFKPILKRHETRGGYVVDFREFDETVSLQQMSSLSASDASQ